MRHPNVNFVLVRLPFFRICYQAGSPRSSRAEKSDTAKHSLGEKVSWYSTGDDVAGNDRFVFVLFYGRERAEDKEGN